LLAEFSSVVDAVRCGAEVQRAMADRNAETPEDRRITFRVGINLGDVIAEPNDIYGDGVNVAARLEALAEPGGICVSRVVRDQIRDKLPYPFEDRGEQSVVPRRKPHPLSYPGRARDFLPLIRRQRGGQGIAGVASQRMALAGSLSPGSPGRA
jgi:class 3 adenylate cyclase